METLTTPKTNLRKGYYGWAATTYFPMNNERVLKVHTMKHSNGRVSTHCQSVIQKAGDGYSTESFVMFQDFNKSLMTHNEIKRVTEKSISEAHAKALTEIEPMLKEANDFYFNI